MSQADDSTLKADTTTENAQRRSRWLAVGGVAGAVLASSCCILPLVFVAMGVSGAWIGSLAALEPYKPYTLAATAVLLAGGFWHVYFRPQKACADGSYCARPAAGRNVKTSLWFAAVVALLAATVNYWAPLFY